MCLESYILDANPYWTPETIAAARHNANFYIYGPSFCVSLLSLLFVGFTLGKNKWQWRGPSWKVNAACASAVIVLPQIVRLILIVLVHDGLRIGGWKLIPRILGNSCKVSMVLEQDFDGVSTWPCLKETVIEGWQRWNLEMSLLWRSMLLLQGFVLLPMVVGAVFVGEWCCSGSCNGEDSCRTGKELLGEAAAVEAVESGSEEKSPG